VVVVRVLRRVAGGVDADDGLDGGVMPGTGFCTGVAGAGVAAGGAGAGAGAGCSGNVPGATGVEGEPGVAGALAVGGAMGTGLAGLPAGAAVCASAVPAATPKPRTMEAKRGNFIAHLIRSRMQRFLTRVDMPGKHPCCCQRTESQLASHRRTVSERSH
jgi:hypothetical protein